MQVLHRIIDGIAAARPSQVRVVDLAGMDRADAARDRPGSPAGPACTGPPTRPPRIADEFLGQALLRAALLVIEIFTDGACQGNPGPGGWAWAVAPDGVVTAAAAHAHTTNQRMELQAVLEALRAIEGDRSPSSATPPTSCTASATAGT